MLFILQRMLFMEKIEGARARTHGTFRQGGEWILDWMSKRCWTRSGKLTKKSTSLRSTTLGLIQSKATLQRSPDRIIGLQDALRKPSRIPSFSPLIPDSIP